MKDWSDDPSHQDQTLLPRSYISLQDGQRQLERKSKSVFLFLCTQWYSMKLRCHRLSDQSHVENLLRYIWFQPLVHNWCNKGYHKCYPVCWMVLRDDPMLLIERECIKFPFMLSEWSLTICQMPYSHKIKCIIKQNISFLFFLFSTQLL